MYFHGLDGVGTQVTRVATSWDGIRFDARPEVLGRPYMRVFQHGGMIYALAMPGQLYRSADGLSAFEPGPGLFNPCMRHSALLKRGAELWERGRSGVFVLCRCRRKRHRHCGNPAGRMSCEQAVDAPPPGRHAWLHVSSNPFERTKP